MKGYPDAQILLHDEVISQETSIMPVSFCMKSLEADFAEHGAVTHCYLSPSLCQ